MRPMSSFNCATNLKVRQAVWNFGEEDAPQFPFGHSGPFCRLDTFDAVFSGSRPRWSSSY